MGTEDKNPKGDAPGSEGQNPTTSTAPPATPPAQPKVEVKDGVILVDGKKYVKESDLIAAKESLQGQLEKAQQTHNSAVDNLRLEVDAANKKVAQANAALEEAKQARASGDISAEELSRIKQEAETAKSSLAGANTSALDYRRKFIMAVYNIPADSDVGKKLMEKDMSQLESFEEALKALGTGRGGPGNYAVGGGGGGATPLSSMDRAKALLANTPFRGVRNQPPNQA